MSDENSTEQPDAIAGSIRAAADRVTAHPLRVVAAFASFVQLYAAVRIFSTFSGMEWLRLRDSVIFEYHGWQLARGKRLYVDLWEIKPPLAFEFTGVLALFSGGNVFVYHLLNLVVTSAAVVASAVLAAAIVRELTDDSVGAIVAGVAVFSFPAYIGRALVGFKSKYFVVLCALFVLWFVLRERWALAGVASAAVIGFWQLAIVVPVIGLVEVVRRGDRADLRAFLGGGLALAGVMLLPVVVWGTVPGMIAQAVLTPFLIAGGGAGPLEHATSASNLLGNATAVGLLGTAAYASSFRGDRLGREWPLVVVTGWFAFVFLFLDLDSFPDLFPWFAVAVLGIGLLVGRSRARGRRVIGAAVAVMVLVSVLTLGGFSGGSPGLEPTWTYDRSTELTPAMPLNNTEQQYVFWNGVEPPSCRLFAGPTQAQLVRTANLSEPGQPFWRAECGRLDPVWDAVVRKYS